MQDQEQTLAEVAKEINGRALADVTDATALDEWGRAVGASERDSGKSTEPPSSHGFAPDSQHHIKREPGL